MASTIKLYEQKDQDLVEFEIRSTFNSDKLVHLILLLCASLATIVVFFIILFLFQNAGNFFRKVNLEEFLFDDQWLPTDEEDPQFDMLHRFPCDSLASQRRRNTTRLYLSGPAQTRWCAGQ